MAEERGAYRAYMLRLWQTRREGNLAWWASLESPHTGERHQFTDLESMFDFLKEEVGDSSPGPLRSESPGEAVDGE